MAELTDFSYGKTVCQKRHELCEPRKIKHVSWDADDTMWTIEPHTIASNIYPPFRLIDPDTLEVIGAEPVKPVVSKPPITPKPKRPLYRGPEEEEFDDWWKTEPAIEKEQELKVIQDELYSALTPKQIEVLGVIPESLRKETKKEKPAETRAPEPAMWLDDLPHPNIHQSPQIDTLIKRYGKKKCKIVDVHGDHSLSIDCQGEVWRLTKEGKLSRENPPTVLHSRSTIIKLLPTFRETMSKLKEKGITMSVISLNSPGTVKRIIEAFGMGNDFIEIKDTWENKGKVFADITEKHHINPCNAMFVDNMISHVEDVSKKCGLSLVIGKGKDVEKPVEILNYIEGPCGQKT